MGYPKEVYKTWMELLAKMNAAMYSVGNELAGEAFVKRMEELFFEEGARVTKETVQHLGITGTDCMAIGRIGDAIDESLGITWDGFIEQSPTGYKKDQTSCPMAEFFSEAPDLCVRMVPAFARGMCAAINPDVTYRIEGCMAKGDKTCGIRIEMKKQSDG
jgi:hypothetical protein